MKKEEHKAITDYFKYIREVFDLATRCWVSGEGRAEISVSDNKGHTEASLKGGPTWRSSKVENGEHE